MVVSAVLARMRAVDGTPLFILKGGVAMQLRFEHRARTSADIDMIFRRDLALLDSTFADASGTASVSSMGATLRGTFSLGCRSGRVGATACGSKP
jgi:hypothetical protein